MTGSRLGRTRLLVLIGLVAINCRAPVIGVAPILGRMIEDLGLSHTAGGFLFSLPVLLMGLLAIPGGLLADRSGPGRVIGIGLLVAGAASALRAADGSPVLFAATLLVGGAIGVVQPALPRIVRERFGDRVGFATGVYSGGFFLGTLLAVVGTSTWLLPALGRWGWRGTFVFWGLVAAATAAGWYRALEPGAAGGRGAVGAGAFAAVLRDSLLWRIALLQMTNSAAFYTTNAWLTAYYESLGWPLARAAAPLGVFSAVGAVAGFLAPTLTDRARARRPTLLAACLLSVGGLVGLLVSPQSPAWLWSGIFGAGLYASFTIGLALPVDISPPARVATATGVALTVGYAGALVGPLLAGYLRDVTGSFAGGITAMLALTVAMTGAALALPETYGWTATARAVAEPRPAAPAA